MIFAHRIVLTGEAVQLPSIRPRFNEARLSTPSSNSNAVHVANSPVNTETANVRFAIPAGSQFNLKVSDLSQLWIDGTASDALDLLTEINEGREAT